jgi:hypothetical protein
MERHDCLVSIRLLQPFHRAKLFAKKFERYFIAGHLMN